MNWRFLSVAVAIASASPAYSQTTGTSSGLSPQHALVKEYCVGCHNERLRHGNLVLSTRDVGQPHANAAVWEKAIRKVRAGMMPPAGARRPDATRVEAFATTLESALDKAAT